MSSERSAYVAGDTLTCLPDEVVLSQLHYLKTARIQKETLKKVHWDSSVIDNEKQAGEMTSQQRLLTKRNGTKMPIKRTLMHSVVERDLTMEDFKNSQRKPTLRASVQPTNLSSSRYLPCVDYSSPTRHRRHVQNRSSKAKTPTQNIDSTLSRESKLEYEYHIQSIPQASRRRSAPPPAPRPPRLPTPELPPVISKEFCSCCNGIFTVHDSKCCDVGEDKISVIGSCGCPDAHWGEHIGSCQAQENATGKMNYHRMPS
ncbi:hypothetical protein B7463_g8136, partial [Scytalidium lignicola]